MDKTTIAQAIDIQYAANHIETQRKHLGMSQIGDECERKTWYAFNQCKTINHEGRMLRLFNFGHSMEPEFADLLQSIGFRVYLNDPKTGEQFHVQDPDNVFFSGSLDCVAVSPETDCFDGVKPSTAYIVDFKTASKSSFNQFVKKGLKDWNIKYFTQLQCYMGFSAQLGKSAITNAMIFVFNKDNHEIATETIEFNDFVFDAMRERAKMIVENEKPPVRISDDPNYFGCRFCDYKELCHGGEIAEPSCRNCGFGNKKASKGEKCDKGYNMKPCANHVYNPYIFDGDLIPIKFHPEHDAMELDGFVNAPHKAKDHFGDKPVLTSREIYELYLNNKDQDMVELILKFAGKFDASVEWMK